MSDFRLLVQLHNIANLPKELALGGQKVFNVVLTHTNTEGGGRSAGAPDISATFETKEGVTFNDRLEAKLDGKNEWVTNATFDVTITIYEQNPFLGGSGSVVATSAPITINARDIVEVKKISTRIIGTSLGQVGVSFAVAPSDMDGYSRRLEQLLRQYNPSGVPLVPQVVKAHSEVEAFTKVMKKYNLVDYRRRITEYFELYGRAFLPQVDTILAEWENREEELMRNLILDNGPELNDVDIRKRLVAFAEKYEIHGFDADRIAESGRLPQDVMAALVKQYGPEPDPRTYCFPTVFYNGASGAAASNAAAAGPSASMAPAANNTMMADASPSVGPAPSSRPPLPQTNNNTVMGRNNNMSAYGGQTPGNNAYGNGGGYNNNQSYAAPSPYSGSAQLLGANSGSVLMSATPSGTSTQLVELWSKLCEDLRTSNVPLSELHYVNESSFEALLVELGYPPHTRAQLSAEWQRRVRSALRQETLTAGDSLYEAARRDILTIGNLLPLNVSVVGVVSIKNSEHEASFSLRLNDAKVRATERMLLVGDYTKLLNIAVHGICPTPQRTAPAGIFYRNPLSVYHRPTSVSILVCDVVVGKPQVIPEITSTPYDATLEFLRDYDSCVFTDPVYGRAVAVYGPQQVLPRYIVHANVDNSITPCPANPERPVEYLVVENNAFACSQCVVMGQYRGKEVIPIEEAATQARTQLSEMHRDADGLVHELTTEEEVCAKTIDSINKGEIRTNALKIAEQIRREAEQKIQQLMLEAEDMERTQLQSVSQQKQRVHAVLVDAQQISHMLQEKATRSATSAIEALLQLRNNPPIAPVRQRAQGVLAQQQAVHELNNNNAAGLVGAFSSVGNNANGGNGFLGNTNNNNTNNNNNNNNNNNTTVYNANATNMNNTTFNNNHHNNTTAMANNNNGPLFDTNGISGKYAPNQQLSVPRGQSTAMGDNNGGRGGSLFRNNGNPNASAINFNNNNNGGAAANPTAANSSNQITNGDLFSKYMALRNEQGGRGNSMQGAQTPMSGGGSIGAAPLSSASVQNSVAEAPLTPAEAKYNKEQMTKGWSEYRKGDRSGALATWSAVYERNSNNSTGARAKAYIAEAIERDYDAASRWYERAIAIDPTDVMSLYNYGVLLESVLGRKRDAMQMFETAYRYGDQTAGKRAQQLRVQLGL